MTKHKYNKYSIPQLNHHSPQSRHSGPLGQVLPTSRRRWYSSSQAAGFTIIEAVLVLAIAGLIFLMVFIALPALQRSQRDSLRKYHAKSLADAVTRYMTNNSRFSSMTSEEYNQTRVSSLIGYGYLKADEMLDPSTGEVYQLDEGSNGYRLYLNYQNIQPGFYGMDSGACVGNTPVDTGSEGLGVEGRSRVYVFGLENGGWVCTSNVMR